MLKLTTFFLFFALALVARSQINMEVKPDGFLFLEGNDSILFFQKLPKDLNGSYSRCNYYHPLYGPDGSRLTEDFPADHLHHRGIFWAWHQILINGEQVADGWELKNFQQKVTSMEFRMLKGLGVFNTITEWKSPLWRDGKEAFVKELTTVTMYPKTGNYRRIDFEIHLKALTDHLQLGGSNDEKGYSGFSIRLKLPQNITFIGKNGRVTPQNTAVEDGNAMNMYGSFLKNEKKGGVVLVSNPANPAPSDRWILRNAASMQNAAYPGRTPVSVPFDEPLVLKYSLLVYQGEMSAKMIKKAMK